jgi:SNF2 family DNA or RNA helicase
MEFVEEDIVDEVVSDMPSKTQSVLTKKMTDEDAIDDEVADNSSEEVKKYDAKTALKQVQSADSHTEVTVSAKKLRPMSSKLVP